MGLFDRVEAKLERGITGIFAKAFRSEVQPVEIASAVRRAMDDRAAIAGKGRTLVPNVFLIELSPTDFERLHEYEDDIADEIVAAAQEHADSQRYDSAGRIRVDLVEADDLETGVFRVRPSKAKRTGATGTHGALRDEGPAAAPGHAPAEQPRSPRPRSDDDSWQEQLTGDHEIPRTGSPAAHDPYADDLAPTAAHVPVPPARRRVNPADRPWLDVDGDRYPLMGALTILGRDDSADILLDDPGISRRHSEIRVTTDGPHHVCSIRDLDSTNGTFLNGERISSARLEDGDRVTVGRTSVTFRAGRRG
jgi:hypothetical protein